MFELEFHGSSYKIEAEGIVAKCAEQGSPYEPRLLERIYDASPTGLAVDVGAHIGNHTLWLAVICRLEVIAFEPSKAIKQLRANVALNGLESQVGVHRVALGSGPGVGRLIEKGQVVAEPWQSMNREMELGEGEVEVRTLDSYGLDEVSVIKIDVEGMEAAVVAGAAETIERCRPLVYAETWGESYTAAVAELLEPLGYRHSMTVRTATPVDEWVPA